MTAGDFDGGFSASICPAFQALIRYGFNEIAIHHSGNESTPQFDVRSTFTNKRTNVAVDVNWDVRGAAISVGVYRAENGIVPQCRSFYGESGKVPIIELRTFLRVKYGDNHSAMPVDLRLSSERNGMATEETHRFALEQVLSQYASALLNEAKELIDGDFSSTASVQSLLRKSRGVKLTRDKCGIMPI